MADLLDSLTEACNRIAELKAALNEFVNAIDATGGCTRDDKDCVVPMADEDWIDLGDAYASACHVLHRKPLITTSEGEE